MSGWSLSVSLSFPKGSNCSVFSNCIPLFPRFLFPIGAHTFPLPIFLSLGRSLNGTFLVTPMYLHRGAPLLWVWPKINKVLRRCHSRTPPVQLRKGIHSSALGRQYPQTTSFEVKGEPKQIRTEVPLLTSLPPYR